MCKATFFFFAGFVNLFEYKTKNIVTPYNSYSNPMRESYETNESNEYFERRSTISSYYRKPLDLRARRLTRIEKLIAFQNKETNGNTKNAQNGSKASSLTPEGIIPCNGYYKYIRPKERLNPQPIYEYKTNDVSQISHKIPKRCFQVVNVKNFNTRNAIVDTSADNCFTTKKVLNSAAFKANFCDVLIDKLSQDLNLNKYSLQSSVVHEEFIVISQPVVVNFVTSVIEIEDWSEHLKINTKSNRRSSHSIEWPTQHMEKIIHILPCVLVAKGYVEFTEENQDYEKEWKIEFPKAEEYLLLHMMHSHVRCYLFALIVYKSFIEKEINSASLGPKHLLHLLFWRVNKDFLGWPEDKPGETLINFFKILYKKLQNKFLRDFFIRSRNLFANSYVKDLHKAQTIIKLFLDNPVPYIMKAMKNLKIDDNFYCTFNYPALNTILTTYNKTISKPKKQNTKEKNESIKDREMKWRKSVIKQIQLERKIEEDLQYRESVDSINVEIIPKLQLKSSSGCQLLELFISHFIEMGLKSTEKEVLDQASMYLTQSKWLLNLLPLQEMNHEKRKELVKKVTEFEERYNKVLKLCSMHKNEKNFNNNCDELVLREEILEAKDDSGLSVISTNPNETKVKINTNDMASEFCDEYDTKL